MADFPFIYVCDLLEDLERLRDSTRRLLVPRELSRLTTEKFVVWSKSHCGRLNACYLEDDAVGRTLQPESSADRVNGLDQEKLEHVIARILMLPTTQVVKLRKWREGIANGDLASCVAQVIEHMPTANPVRALTNRVTVQEIDQGLLKISAFNSQSSPAVRSLAHHLPQIDQLGILEDLYLRMQHREAKWLTRLILKSYAPVFVPLSPEISATHSGLPSMLCLKVELRTPKLVPMLRHAYSGWIKGTNTLDNDVDGLSTLQNTPPNSMQNVAQSQLNIEGTSRLPSGSSSSASTSNFLPTPPRTLTSSSKNLIPTSPIHADSLETPLEDSSDKFLNEGLPPAHLGSPSPDTRVRVAKPRSLDTLTPSPETTFLCAGTGSCSLATPAHRCPLWKCFIILAPHLSIHQRLTETLLPLHGCRYAKFLHSPISATLPSSFPIAKSDNRSRRMRQIALVDSRNTKATVEFMKDIRALQRRKWDDDDVSLDRESTRRNDEYIEVYDWRLLEMLTRMERGLRTGKEASLPWRRCWIGAI